MCFDTFGLQRDRLPNDRLSFLCKESHETIPAPCLSPEPKLSAPMAVKLARGRMVQDMETDQARQQLLVLHVFTIENR
jgi:hypothetical protein